MDFLSYMRDQMHKLNSRDYVQHLWDELEGRNTENEVSSVEFNNHLPILLDQFWEIACEKVGETNTLEEMDDDLRTYILVLIYQCITQSHELISFKCVLHALEIYIHLLTLPQSEECFNSKLYLITLSTLQTSLEATVSEEAMKTIIFKLKKFLKISKMSVADLEVTLATLIHVIFVKTRVVVQSFEPTESPLSVVHEAVLCLKVLVEQESAPSRKFVITTYLFNGLRKQSMHVAPRQFNAIQTTFRHLIKSLHLKFKEDNYKSFMNAFIHVWRHSDFTFFGEAVLIMNGLKEKHYRTLLDILRKIMMTESPHRNCFKLTLAIICTPPRYVPIEKVKVTNQILLKQILLNCVSDETQVSNSAVESLAEILKSPDLEKECIKEPMKIIINGDENLNAPTIIRGLQSLLSKKWGTRSKNKHLFVIIVSVILMSEDDHPGVYRESLECLTEQCSPFDLKPFLPLLSETYVKKSNRNHNYSALQVLKIIFRMAIHPMASSTEFVKYLYTAMIYPSVCKGVQINSELFINPLISDDFKFSEFFEKCQTLGLIRNEHVGKMMGNIANSKESNLKLLCAIIHLTTYKELSIIADHINDNFMTICNHPNLNYLFYIYNKICKNGGRSNQSLRCNEIMVTFIKHHLLRQSLRWNSVANAFALLKTLEEFTNLPEDFNRFKEQYEGALATSLETRGNFLPMLYYSQLVIFGKVTPSEANLKAVTDFLTLCSDESRTRSPDFNPKLWIGCLLLYTNICVIKPNLVETCLDYLQSALNCSVTVVNLAAINMTFDLCNMVTHNFEDLIRYMFKQLVYGDHIFRKTCLLKIDRLMRDDYLKLDLEQLFIIVATLADRNVSLSDYAQQLLSEHFLMANSTIITRHFVAIIVHLSGYKKHSNYQLSKNGQELVQQLSRNVLDRRKMYNLLFNNLPVKNRFTVLFLLSTQILENMIKGTVKIDHGFWKMIKDSIYVFKLVTSSSNEDEPGENFYKKVTDQISKHLLKHSEYPDKSLYSEYHKEIIKGTETLLKLLFFNDNENIQKHISISLFDTIAHWTHFLMPDLVHIVHVERTKDIANYYSKFEKYYKNNSANLRYSEESFESDASSFTSSGTLFSTTDDYIPNFDT